MRPPNDVVGEITAPRPKTSEAALVAALPRLGNNNEENIPSWSPEIHRLHHLPPSSSNGPILATCTHLTDGHERESRQGQAPHEWALVALQVHQS